MKLKASKVPYSSVVGGSIMLVSPTGAAVSHLAIMGASRGLTKEQSEALGQRLVELINEHGIEVPDPQPAPPKAAPPPVDRNQRTLVDGSPVTPDHRELKPNGQQKDYVVLSAEERAKGFVQPVRRTYVHKKCGVATTMGLALAETYARDPSFYSGTFCVGCGKHFTFGEPDGEFHWDDGSKVGVL